MRVIPHPSPTHEVRFATQHRAGGFDFSTHSGHVRADISATSPNPDDLAPLDQASVTATPDEAEAIGHAWIMWANHARAQHTQRNNPAPSHAAHSHAEKAN